MIGVAVIGYGYWGPNLARNFAESPGWRLVGVSDLSQRRLAAATVRFPGIDTSTDYHIFLRDPRVEAVAIATPVSTHFSIAREALQARKHVLVEKPLATMAQEALQLLEEAERCQRVLMVDHTFVYTGAVRRIKELLEQGHLGELYYYDSVRVNLGLFQHEINVLWDLAVHDLAIMDFLLPFRPCAVSATGMASLIGQPQSIAYLTCFFDNRFIAHLHVNWLAPVKVRRALIGGDKRMLVCDDLELDEKIRIYDRGVRVTNDPENLYHLLVSYRTGDMWAPYLDRTEALAVEVVHFLEAIRGIHPPITDGNAGLRVVRILEAAERSLQQRGSPVELNG